MVDQYLGPWLGAEFDRSYELNDVNFFFRRPTVADGVRVHALIAGCPPLDSNSMYCNLLQCSHFAETCVLAENEGDIAAFLSAYRKPHDPEVMFIWQIAVAAKYRGLGLASRMLDALMRRSPANHVSYIETSITPSNQASANLFERFAQKQAATLTKSVLFSKAEHFGGQHDDEVLFRIGPLQMQNPSQ